MTRPSPALEIRFPSPPTEPSLPDRLCALLDDHEPLAIDEGVCAAGAEHPLPDRWVVHFADAAARDRAADSLRRALEAEGLHLTPIDVPDEGWADRSQRTVRAIRVGDLVVAPPWDVPDVARASLVVITPSTGFGTGHHATTRLCLRMLQALDVGGRTVLDLGTGSGVLAIAAVRRGAARATGVDCDPDALAAAGDNVARNGVDDRVALRLGDLADFTGGGMVPADVVLANLTAGVLSRHADTIRALTAPLGSLVLSGVLAEQSDAVVAAFEADGVRRLVSCEREEEWVALVLRNH